MGKLFRDFLIVSHFYFVRIMLLTLAPLGGPKGPPPVVFRK